MKSNQIEKKKIEPEEKTCSECGFVFYANHECDPEVLWNRAKDEEIDRQERNRNELEPGEMYI
jgi:hypothetical protein